MRANTKEIEKLENEIKKSKAKLASLRKKIKPELVEDYSLLSDNGKSILLSSLFGKKSELILIHNMGSSCPYCTLWGDGFNGLIHHLENRAAFVIETPETPKTIAAFKKSRGWKIKMVSSKGSSFRKDMGYEYEGDPAPGVSTFIKKNKKIYRIADTGFGPGDNYCSAWDLMDLLPGKALNWGPKFKY